jgi:hypothetical protein
MLVSDQNPTQHIFNECWEAWIQRIMVHHRNLDILMDQMQTYGPDTLRARTAAKQAQMALARTMQELEMARTQCRHTRPKPNTGFSA